MGRDEEQARTANQASEWDRIWGEEGDGTWRTEALEAVYARVTHLVPENATVFDLGGGRGLLADRIRKARSAKVTVVDQSGEALSAAREKKLGVLLLDLEEYGAMSGHISVDCDVMVSTETLEHLSEKARDKIFRTIQKLGCKALLSVPNDRLGPDEEPQHAVKFTALEFLFLLRSYFPEARVECLGPEAEHGAPAFLLGVVGYPKSGTLSVTLPVRDEAKDLGRTLATFRAVADEMVIGVDPRTTDTTFEVARKYAEHVFYLDEVLGNDRVGRVPEGGVHFAHLRNQCIDRCTSEWIFMTEGHEILEKGVDTLLALGDLMPTEARVGFVLRTGGPPGNRQQWGFPWLFKRSPDIRFERATHNELAFPPKTFVVRLPQVRTLHERVHDRSLARAEQRKVQNRITLMGDWLANQSELSLAYLGSEWREHDTEKAIRYLREFVTVNRSNGPMRYNTRLVLAKELAALGRSEEAREALLPCVGDDWERTDHYIWLGDLAFNSAKPEEALRFYELGATRIDNPPFTTMWIDLSFYGFIPAQRLAMCHGELGHLAEALAWARRVVDLLPQEIPAEVRTEALENVRILEEATHDRAA